MKNLDLQVKKYFLISIILIISFVITHIMISVVFIANSPQIRPQLAKYLVQLILEKTSQTTQKIATLPTVTLKPSVKQLTEQQVDLIKSQAKQLATGVRAASNENISYTEYNLNTVTYREISYKLSSGKTVKIRVPNGIEPPPQAVADRL
ncbi:hypothetical protein HGA88_06525 [Candidatus Roizmanbacteria bacterium]|nr:hypothetical protein [Candidatus Roizmanbacteria bacterium]